MVKIRSFLLSAAVFLLAGAMPIAQQQAAEAPAADRRVQTRPAVSAMTAGGDPRRTSYAMGY